MENTLRRPLAARPPRRSRDEWDAIIDARQTLDDQRRRLEREAAALARQIESIDAELESFLELETAGKTEQVLPLRRFVLSFVWKPASAMAVAFAALRRLSSEEKQQLESSLPPKRVLVVQTR